MRYENLQQLDARIESIIEKKVKCYKSDWEKYDRPSYEKFKKEKDGRAVLIARECGTWFFTEKEAIESEEVRLILKTYNDPVYSPDSNDYYIINISNYQIVKINPRKREAFINDLIEKAKIEKEEAEPFYL